MCPKTREDFVPDIGGFLDGVSGDIVKAIFELASGKYADQVMMGGGNAKLPVVLTLTIESPDLEKPAVQSFSVGSSEIWEIVNDGKSISNIKSPEKHSFRKGSLSWHLVEAMMAAVGDGDMDKGQEFFVNRDKYMTESAFFTGLSFDWEVKEIQMEIGKDKKLITSRPPLPVKFLGEVGKATKAASKTEKAGTPAPADAVLDKLLIENAGGKSEKDLKTFAVHSAEIKKNEAYLKSVISGKKMRELENAGALIKDPDTSLYL